MNKFIYSGGQIWPPGQRKKPPAAGGGRARAVVDSFLLQQKTRGCRLVGSLVCGWSVLVSIVVLVARERQRTASFLGQSIRQTTTTSVEQGDLNNTTGGHPIEHLRRLAAVTAARNLERWSCALARNTAWAARLVAVLSETFTLAQT